MGRKIEEKFEHGTYTAEFVEGFPLPPLGENRKTIILPDTPAEKLFDACAASLGIFLGPLMKAFSERWGEEAWEVATKVIEDIGRSRAERMLKRLNIDVRDARSIGRIFDFEDNSMGIKGEWVEYGPKRAVKREYYCSHGRYLTDCPEVCTRLFGELEASTFEALGIKLKSQPLFTKLLPKGDPYCEVVVELED